MRVDTVQDCFFFIFYLFGEKIQSRNSKTKSAGCTEADTKKKENRKKSIGP